MTQDIKQRVEKVTKQAAEYIRDDERYRKNDLDDADAVDIMQQYADVIKDLATQNGKLVETIRQTVANNLHLADGNNCTLIRLTTVLKELGINPTNGDV